MLKHQRTNTVEATAEPQLVLAGQQLSLPHVDTVARGRGEVQVTDDPAVLSRVEQAAEMVTQAVAEEARIYGVTTGFGSLAAVPVSAKLAGASQENLLSFLAAGAGRPVDRRHVRAAMLLRANMLLRGASGVRRCIIDRFVQFLNQDAVPVVGELGSIGASGDLVPLGTVARAILGHPTPSQVNLGDKIVDAETAMEVLGLEPLPLLPKEGLAMVNGTSFSAAIAANCVQAARPLLAMSLSCHAMMLRALWGHTEPLAEFVHQSKPHPGQLWSARLLRQLMEDGAATNGSDSTDRPHVQDVYSLRCLPQYLGPIVETIERVANVVHVEMNSITDNPIIDVDDEQFCQSGNFLGQYIGIAMDDLRRSLGLLAKHLDVQIARLVAPEFSHGLPASLKGNSRRSYNMGLKGLQITGNSIMPMLTYYGNPLVEHFPTHAEQFNQNVNGLSWGSANLAWRSVELFNQYVAIALIFAVQSLDLRAYASDGHYDGRKLIGPAVGSLYEAVCDTLDQPCSSDAPLVYDDADQSLEEYLRRLSESMDGGGPLVQAVAPIVDSLVDAALSG